MKTLPSHWRWEDYRLGGSRTGITYLGETDVSLIDDFDVDHDPHIYRVPHAQTGKCCRLELVVGVLAHLHLHLPLSHRQDFSPTHGGRTSSEKHDRQLQVADTHCRGVTGNPYCNFWTGGKPMSIDMNEIAGKSVRLRSGGVTFFGGLNSLFLIEEGYKGPVPVIETKTDQATVKLPSGRKLTIYPRDLDL